ITAKHPWLVIACDSCGTVVDLDLHGVIAASVALRVVGGRWQVRINAHPPYARPTSPVLAAMMFG
ncbi:MAG: hypothetical protein WB048_01800, partial [Pseudolabrys sp.]